MAHVGIVAPRRDDTVIRGGCSPRREETRSYLSNTSPLRAMTTSIAAATVTPGRDPADYDDDALDRLAELIADRVAARFGGLRAGRSQPEPLVDAAEITRCAAARRSASGSKRSSRDMFGQRMGSESLLRTNPPTARPTREKEKGPAGSRAFLNRGARIRTGDLTDPNYGRKLRAR